MNSSNFTLAAALRALEEGRLVAFPTETVYGLGADAENPQAVARIYAAKERPANHPVIVHLAPEADLDYWVRGVPALARRLIETFWPGPLTLILPRALHIPDAVSGGQDSIGVRCPAHPVAQDLLRSFKGGRGGVAAPSANKFGQISPTTAAHVASEFPDALMRGLLAGILEGGQSQVGIESTILDISRLDTRGPVLLRPGQIDQDALAEVLGALPGVPDAAAPRASGTLDAHYAPRTPLVLIDAARLEDTVQRLHRHGRRVALLGEIGWAGRVEAFCPAAGQADAYAHALYASLRTLDQAAADLILVQTPPASLAWQGVNDRLRRAAFDSRDVLARLLE